MRINFSSKTKGSRKITPFYTIKAEKSRVCTMTKRCWSRNELSIEAHFKSVQRDIEYDYFLFSALLIYCHREAASSRHSFRAGINCSLIFSDDMGEPSPLPIVRTRSCHGCDVGLFWSYFSIYLPRYRDGCRPGTTALLRLPLCAAQNTCPAVCRHPQSLLGQGGAPSLSLTHCLLRPRKELRRERAQGPMFTRRSASQNCVSSPEIK